MRQEFKIDKDEYDRLRQQIGVNFEAEPIEINTILVRSLQEGMPLGWHKEQDIYGRPVYYNRETKETTVVHPISKALRVQFLKYF